MMLAQLILAAQVATQAASLVAQLENKSCQEIAKLYPDVTCVEPEATTAAVKADKRPKPRLEIRVNRTVGDYSLIGNKRTIFNFQARLLNTNKETWCGGIAWLWPPYMTISSMEGDCEPFEEASEQELEVFTRWPIQRKTFPPGDWKINVFLIKDGRIILKAEKEVHIIGW